MGQASTIGLNSEERVFQAHGTHASGHAVFRKRLVRAKLLGAMMEPISPLVCRRARQNTARSVSAVTIVNSE